MELTELEELRDLLPNCLRQERLRIARQFEDLSKSRVPEAVFRTRLVRLVQQARRSVALRHRRHEQLPQVSYPANLPIVQKKDEIISAIKNHPVVVIAGETGSGKTTQLPKMCLEAGYGIEGKIGCTQPRRVAALSVSRRIAAELNGTWGREVGSKIRFSDQSSPESYIKVMTDGILLAEAQADRDLTEYEVIIIDEAHERSLNIDFLLGHLKRLSDRRPELKIIITSATIDTESFAQAFNRAPVIQVSGRLYPVEIRYAPIDSDSEELGELTYVDAAVNAVESVLAESNDGDVLIFMPSERDIRETQDDLAGRYSGFTEIIPLFGRLSGAEQERVFAPCARRKLIIATNIAETSLTIPGIRYVIDTGLARISRYSPRTRTKRLPIEPIAQSSANQRAGRSGRVACGVCIRLFSEEDYAARPKFTQPEIQRANLAEVILRMKAFGLGDIETFPFLNPPQPQAIQSGYQLLQELGALDADRQLTSLGRELARLPIDPSAGRMVLQSIREGALEPVLIIAAGLSIQDPRERPLDKEDAAAAAHRQFVHPDSDFITLLNIWNAFHDTWETLKTQNQLRKFCRANFLSFQRMREWCDVHAQLAEAVEEHCDLRKAPPPSTSRGGRGEARPAPGRSETDREDAAIHRSVLTGLFGHVAHREERNQYRTAGNRQVMVFPGSGLFDRNGQSGKGSREGADATKADISQPEWVVAGELVETSRLYIRTLAKIDPAWIIELGEHVCKCSYTDPQWNVKGGRVLVRERIRLFGLEVSEKWIDYGKVNPVEATEIFIRSALIDEPLDLPHPFVQKNRELRERLELSRTRARETRLPDLDAALFDFYAQRIENVSSIHDLNRLVRERQRIDPEFLCAKESDLVGDEKVAWDHHAFPAEVEVGGHRLAVKYAYAPGEDHDGITIQIPTALAPAIETSMLDWLIPGLRAERLEVLLKALPKSLRVPLMPIAPKAKELAERIKPGMKAEDLSRLVHGRYQVQIPANAWRFDEVPPHLQPRVAIVGRDHKAVLSGRDLTQLKQKLEFHQTPVEEKAWLRATAQWEKYQLQSWTFGDMPAQIEVANPAGLPLFAFPGLLVESGHVHVKLFRKKEEAERESVIGFVRLIEMTLHKELAWLQKDLRTLEKFKDLYLTLGPADELLSTAYACLRRHIIPEPSTVRPLNQSLFDQHVNLARSRITGIVPKFAATVGHLLQLRQEILVCRKPYPGMRSDLDLLVPKQALTVIPFEQLPHVARYLKAMLVRAERAALNPVKDAERSRQVQVYIEKFRQLQKAAPQSETAKLALHQLRWMLEEFKVSVFAQELGTAYPVSPKRLDAQIATIQTS